jgi:hypothetical protein
MKFFPDLLKKMSDFFSKQTIYDIRDKIMTFFLILEFSKQPKNLDKFVTFSKIGYLKNYIN